MKTIRNLIPVFIALFLISCSKDQKVPIRLMLTDNPTSYDSVNVHIKGINVKMNDGGWIQVAAKDTIVNLLDLQNGVTMLLAEDEVPEGTLKEVRFILGDDSYVVATGDSHPLATPSAEDSGLKIKIDKKLNETLNTFTLDFDAAASIKEENGDYKLSPVIKVVE